jgi:azurin
MLSRSLVSGVLISMLVAPLAVAAQQKPAKPAAAAPAGSSAARTVEIAAGDDMKYSVTNITAKPGETLRLRLVSKGTLPKVAMSHNVVVLKPTAKVLDFVNAGATARATDFIPAEMKDQVLAATAMAGPGETVEVLFKVPAGAATYNYVCTFPGHFAAGMKGTIVAK